MADLAETNIHHAAESDAERGAEAARRIWKRGRQAEDLIDPRTPSFARAVIDGLMAELSSSPGTVIEMMENALHAAADLNVAPFQGLVEVIQNADDVGATEVRFALREQGGSQQLLVVHNGLPVTCHHVLGMALPFLTTKTNRIDQRGRFGIGLKTLNRIADLVAVHSAPYHFSGNHLSLTGLNPEPPLTEFYDPASDTLLVLNLKADFDELALKEWFDGWDDDGLLFLGSVGRFRWCTIDGKTIAEKTLSFGSWEEAAFVGRHDGVMRLRQRRVWNDTRAWIIWKATVRVPAHLHPQHKARSDTTDLSIALSDHAAQGTLYIGFKTLVPVGLSFSLDGQFDPSTAREGAIETAWNNWLIERWADLVIDVAAGLLTVEPLRAWALIPLEDERVGKEEDRWLRGRFDAALGRVRRELGERAAIAINPDLVPLASLAYEGAALAGFLAPGDIVTLVPDCRPLPESTRDQAGRWRAVLDALAVSTVIGTDELLEGFDNGVFAAKDPQWWVGAAHRLTKHHPDEDLFGRPCWLSDDGRALTSRRSGETDRPLVFGEPPSAFAVRWTLLDHLHEAYGGSAAGGAAVDWLVKHAAFTSHVDPVIELRAFAERFAGEPFAIGDADLRLLRDRFDELTDRSAEPLGRKVGAVLLLDGTVYKARKPQKLKVSPVAAYLPRTIDSDHPNWPVAAGTVAGITWIGARYDEVLKTGATRTRRRRDDGTISRGPRKFLMLLGADVSPRLEQTGPVSWGSPSRVQHLRAAGAERVAHDHVSPDLSRVLKDLQRVSKKEAKLRSPALLRALSRNWDRLYHHNQTVPAEHLTRYGNAYSRGMVTAAWLSELCETEWVAVGRGGCVLPAAAVIKSVETQTLYKEFAAGLEPGDVGEEIAAALHLITDVRVVDLVDHIAKLRNDKKRPDEAELHQIYRTIAKRCPASAAWNTPIGGLTAQELRRRFAGGDGLIYVGSGEWRRPDQVLRGRDIFHDRQRFVPGGPALAHLWLTLGVRQPSLDDCLIFCRALAATDYTVAAAAALIDVYRSMEPLLPDAERKHRARLKVMPLVCDGRWTVDRPIYFIEDDELRRAVAAVLPRAAFWSPPCSIRDLPHLVSMIGITIASPLVEVTGDRARAMECGDSQRARFERAVDHLSDEMARNDAATRDRISIGWESLKALPLFVYEEAVPVRIEDALFSTASIPASLQAVLGAEPRELHVSENGLGDREYGGRAIASFFPVDVRRKIGGEWALAWQKSLERDPDAIRLASDEEHQEAMEQQAAKISGTAKTKIKVSAPASRKPGATLRTLKEAVGAIAKAAVMPGSAPKPVKATGGKGLAATPPAASPPNTTEPTSAAAYTNDDLQQRGWEILEPVLNTSPDERLVDFRRRHGVGADGVINWKTFVEMKATGRGPQSSIEMSNAEFERAKERGMDFILALVSGLEVGQKDEVRLILDPANRLPTRPMNGVRLGGLLEAPCIIVHFEDADGTEPGVTAAAS